MACISSGVSFRTRPGTFGILIGSVIPCATGRKMNEPEKQMVRGRTRLLASLRRALWPTSFLTRSRAFTRLLLPFHSQSGRMGNGKGVVSWIYQPLPGLCEPSGPVLRQEIKDRTVLL